MTEPKTKRELNLGVILRSYIGTSGKSSRSLAEEIGVDKGIMLRITSGEMTVLSPQTIGNIIKWLLTTTEDVPRFKPLTPVEVKTPVVTRIPVKDIKDNSPSPEEEPPSNDVAVPPPKRGRVKRRNHYSRTSQPVLSPRLQAIVKARLTNQPGEPYEKTN